MNKAKNGKPLSQRPSAMSRTNKNTDGKDVSKCSVASNGTHASESQSKQTSLGTKNRSNEGQAADQSTKPEPARDNAYHSKVKSALFHLAKMFYLYITVCCNLHLNWVL